jgi:hypothetical protein
MKVTGNRLHACADTGTLDPVFCNQVSMLLNPLEIKLPHGIWKVCCKGSHVQQACLGPSRVHASPTLRTLAQILPSPHMVLFPHVALLCAQGCCVCKQVCGKVGGTQGYGRRSGEVGAVHEPQGSHTPTSLAPSSHKPITFELPMSLARSGLQPLRDGSKKREVKPVGHGWN